MMWYCVERVTGLTWGGWGVGGWDEADGTWAAEPPQW